MNVKDRVYKVLSNELRVDTSQINDEMEIGDIKQWDSLAQVNLIIALEKEFHLTFDVDETLEMDSVLDIIGIISERLKINE